MSSEPCVLGIVGVGTTAADLPWSLPLLYLWANSPAREVCVWRAACGRVWQARLAAPTPGLLNTMRPPRVLCIIRIIIVLCIIRYCIMVWTNHEHSVVT